MVAQPADGTKTIIDALRKVLAWAPQRAGEPRVGDVFKAVYQVREEKEEAAR